MKNAIDEIKELGNSILEILLTDRTSKKNIIWANDNYSFGFNDCITADTCFVIIPRHLKNKEIKLARSAEKAEVFTPTWVCNFQNNLVDNAWLGYEGAFNSESDNKTWKVNYSPVKFPDSKSWQEYVADKRMEITCGEAPYLTSRYDAISGEPIQIQNRIGLLDRKLRIITENTNSEKEWIEWAIVAYKNIYAFEWSGDNLLLARSNLLMTFIETHISIFGTPPSTESIMQVAEIISWNVWQMDGIKGVIPGSCNTKTSGFFLDEKEECKGCKKKDHLLHNGTYCVIMDWESNIVTRFVDCL